MTKSQKAREERFAASTIGVMKQGDLGVRLKAPEVLTRRQAIRLARMLLDVADGGMISTAWTPRGEE